jgi:Na+/H+ antiporter NhaD/arsenite permease-like protein
MELSAIIAILTFLIAYGILATEKINRTTIVGAGSLVLLVFGVLDLAEAINYVNWETIYSSGCSSSSSFCRIPASFHT